MCDSPRLSLTAIVDADTRARARREQRGAAVLGAGERPEASFWLKAGTVLGNKLVV